MRIRATARGEPDAPPLVKTFECGDGADELIMHHSAEMVKEKLAGGIKVNVNEALVLYCHFVAGQLKAGKGRLTAAADIEREVRRLLSAGQVMVGVPETLRAIAFDVTKADGRSVLVKVEQPISIHAGCLAAAPRKSGADTP